MSPPLPDLLDPWRAVRDRSEFSGHIPLSSLPRLRALLEKESGDAKYRIAFFSDDERRAALRCEVAAVLTLRCQRCLEPLDCPVQMSTLLAMVSGMDEVCQLPERYDPFLMGDVLIRPRDLVEDELLIALPQIAVHEPAVCVMLRSDSSDLQSRAAPGPFSGLAKLKQTE